MSWCGTWGYLLGPRPGNRDSTAGAVWPLAPPVRTRLPTLPAAAHEGAHGDPLRRAQKGPAEPAVAPSSALAGGGTGDIPGRLAHVTVKGRVVDTGSRALFQTSDTTCSGQGGAETILKPGGDDDVGRPWAPQSPRERRTRTPALGEQPGPAA